MSPTGRKKRSRSKQAKKSARCKKCGNVIRIPAGWTVGPAARRHYWRYHREVMEARTGGRR